MSQPQKSATLSPQPGGKPRKVHKNMWGIGGGKSGTTYRYLTIFFNRDGIVQPCRIGEDGRPEPVGQVLELIEDLSRQQAKPPQDED